MIPPPGPIRKSSARTNILLASLAVTFAGLTVIFVADVWGKPPVWKKIPLVDRTFLETTPWRQSYADLVAAKEDMSDYDCYACHDKKKPGVIKFDENHKILVPKEHENIVMGHGSHDRNNLCFNCHNESNLLTLQVRDGRELKFDNSTPLCGSCHGPTYRDWDAGAHGRTSGYWDTSKGAALRLACVNCHDPHTPSIPKRPAAPGPHTLHEDQGAPLAPGTVKPITTH